MRIDRYKILTNSFLTVIVVSVLSFLPAYANDSIVGESGHTVYPLNTENIRMVSEKLMVTIDRQEGAFQRSAHVICEFWFENVSEEKVKAVVGFPGDEHGEPMPSNMKLRDFYAEVNGKIATAKDKKEIIQNKLPDGRAYETVRNWYTWDVTFPAKKKLKVVNSYTVMLRSNQYVDFFRYILVTGANWKGPIERADIELSFENSKELRRWFLYAVPEGFKIEGNKVIWSFDNFKPTENIGLVLIADMKERSRWWSYIIEEMKGKKYEGDERHYVEDDLIASNSLVLRDLLSRDMSDYWHKNVSEYIENSSIHKMRPFYSASREEFANDIEKLYAKVLRNEIFARHGREFKSDDLEWIFENTRWYKPDPDYSDDMLNDIEKKNIQFILDYEKKMGWR